MKLISFAVISLLAITVSAYPHQDPNEQDSEEPQGAASQSAEQPQGVTTHILLEPQSTIDQALPENPQPPLQNKFDDLLKEYEEKQHAAAGLDYNISELERKRSDMESRANANDGPERVLLHLYLICLNKDLAILQESKIVLERELEAIKEELHGLIGEISALDGPQG
ncbi:hypothetical protein BASA81_012229 [Batrachochytrium salamandrivorans]|nr:hypothetical protein BASA62_008217 [Batrachochytrium salamandrivorans]KAH9249982.1 hypothetical protein BASA81_012229 [Batrachochytrium salamandrivorans]